MPFVTPRIISGWAVVSWLGLGLGWCMADRALCERVRTGTLWNVTASPPPKITCGGPWPWVAFFCGPLRSGKWPGHQGARGCGEPQSQRGSLILYETGEVPRGGAGPAPIRDRYPRPQNVLGSRSQHPKNSRDPLGSVQKSTKAHDPR